MEVEINKGSKQIAIRKVMEDVSIEMDDHVAIEEALLIQYKTGSQTQDLTVTMRTPGDDKELALGFLFTEGLIQSIDQVKAVKLEGDRHVVIEFAQDHQPDLGSLDRNFFSTSACGVCGKSSLDSLQEKPFFSMSPYKPSHSDLLKLYDQLSEQQSLFGLTGGIHAAALFDEKGNYVSMKEDVGRHNAMDKLIGEALLNNSIPLHDHIVLLSGRASFELIQKAAMAAIPVVVAVGAPSSLAIETADKYGQLLIGFLKNDGFNIYTQHGK